MTAGFDIDRIRRRFPALEDGWAFFDNAGGSQVLASVADRIADYLLHTNVIHGVPHELSRRSSDRFRQASERLAVFMNAADPAEIVMGPSSTQLQQNLGLAMTPDFEPGDEIIVGSAEHHANVEPWERLRARGVRLLLWPVNPLSWKLELDDLARLMNSRTKLVAFTQVSNVLGTLQDVRAVADFVHARGAEVFVDGVAAAPHRAIDVRASDVDYYVFSLYKVFGPHHAALYGRRQKLLRLKGINHSFFPEDMIPYKLQPGNANAELSWGATAVVDYLEELGAARDAAAETPRERIEAGFAGIAGHEEKLGARFLDWLGTEPRARLFGVTSAAAQERVPTFAFRLEGIDPAEVSRRLGEQRIAVRSGDFYARHLMHQLGVPPNPGVIRVSMAHYNTPEEVDRLIAGLEELLGPTRAR